MKNKQCQRLEERGWMKVEGGRKGRSFSLLPSPFSLSLITIYYLLFTIYCLFATYAGTDTAQFLKFNPDPKTAASGDSSLLSCQPIGNPASLARAYQPELTFSYTKWVEDISHSHVAFNSPFSFGNMGFGLTYLTYGKITGVEDVTQNEYSITDSYDAAFTISYAKVISEEVPVHKEWGSIGTNVKFIKSTLTNYSAEAFAADFGTILNLGTITGIDGIDNINIGLAYKNLGSKIKFVKNESSLPTSMDLSLGMSIPSVKNINITANYVSPKYSNPVCSVGLDIRPIYFLTLRSGYKYSKDSVANGVTAGFGLNMGSVNLNYALKQYKEFSTLSDLGLTHQISVELALGGFVAADIGSEYYLRQHLNKGYELYYQGEYFLAKQKVEDIISSFPNYAAANQLLGKIDTAIGKIVNKKDKRVSTMLKKAKIFYDRNDYINAKAEYCNILQVDPTNAEAEQGLKNIQQQITEVRQEQINQQNSRKITDIWEMAVAYYKKGEFVKSKDKFNQILQINPEHAETKKYLTDLDVQIAQLGAQQLNELYIKGAELFKKERYEEAAKYFGAVSIAAPQRLDAKDFLDKCNQAIAEKEEQHKLEEVVKQQTEKKSEMDGAFSTALKLYEKSKYTSAIEWFRKSKEIAEKYQFDDYLKKSESYINTIKLTLADQYYKDGYKLYQQNRLEETYDQYTKSLNYNPSNVTIESEVKKLKDQLSRKYYELGISCYTKSEIEKAKEYFNKSLFYNPTKDETLRALERIK